MTSPHLSVLLHAGQLFGLRLQAHLAFADSTAAYIDFRDLLQAYLAIKEEPTLMSGLERIAILSVLISAMGEGLSDHRWAEPELRRIDADLASLRIWEDYRLAFASERGFVNASLDELSKASPWRRRTILSGYVGAIPPTWLIMLIPRCVFRDNQLRQNSNLDEILARVSANGSAFDPDSPNPSGPENITDTLEGLHFFLFKISAPVFRELEKRYAKTAIKIHQARIACALESYYLANGSYPEDLTQVAQTLPPDVLLDLYSGKPMIYRRESNESYLLYSVGSNRIDDHGVIDLKKPESRQPDEVWLFAPR